MSGRMQITLKQVKASKNREAKIRGAHEQKDANHFKNQRCP